MIRVSRSNTSHGLFEFKNYGYSLFNKKKDKIK